MYKLVINFILCCCSCTVFTQTKSKASEDTAAEAAIMEYIGVRVHYNADGTGFVESTRTVRVQSEAGVQHYGQLVFGYSSATEKLEVNYARVRKPDGHIVETSAERAQDLAPEILRAAPMYSDYRQRHVSVSGLRPGDVLEYRTTTQVISALAPGEFWFEYNFPRGMYVTEARLEIDIPKSRDVKLKSPKRQYTSAEIGDRHTYTWIVRNIAPDRKNGEGEDSDISADDEDELPDVQLTTFRDWQQVARWYGKLQGEQVVVDDAIRKKAAELTQGASAPQERAQRLYDFVARDIRYVSLSFGIGRYQPHAAPEVMQSSYGDCKDKHALLSSLLRAAGIESYPVLIGSRRKLDVDVPSPAQFDHVITIALIDKDWVWLDATAEIAPYGLLLYPLRDKQAVLAAENANAGLRTTPALSPVKNTLTFILKGKLLEDGDLDGAIEIAADGDSAVPLRMIFRTAAQADWQQLGERLSNIQGYHGKVTDVEVVDLEKPAKPLLIRYKLHQDSYFAVPSSGVTFYPFPSLALDHVRKTRHGERWTLVRPWK
jgi:transglutaminase-like putative cysteine protease